MHLLCVFIKIARTSCLKTVFAEAAFLSVWTERHTVFREKIGKTLDFEKFSRPAGRLPSRIENPAMKKDEIPFQEFRPHFETQILFASSPF